MCNGKDLSLYLQIEETRFRHRTLSFIHTWLSLYLMTINTFIYNTYALYIEFILIGEVDVNFNTILIVMFNGWMLLMLKI